MMNLSPTWITPESSPGLRANASSSSFGWPPYLLMGGTSPRSAWLPGSIEYWAANSPKYSAGVVLAGQLEDLLGPALVVHHDGQAADARPEVRLEAFAEIVLGDVDLVADQLLQRHGRPDDVVAIDIQRNALFFRDQFQPGLHVGRAVGLGLDARRGRAGDFLVDVLPRSR